jgi:hypothetical protein
MNTAIVKAEPLILQRLDQRDERATRLRAMFKDFMVQSFALLGQVRQDFLDKGNDETILGCSTWRAYCQNILGYSESHVRNMLAKSGGNPASKFAPKKPHKKSNRQIADEGAERQAAIEVQQARDRGFEEGEKSGFEKAEILAKAQKETNGASQHTQRQIEKTAAAAAKAGSFLVALNAEQFRYLRDTLRIELESLGCSSQLAPLNDDDKYRIRTLKGILALFKKAVQS